MDYIMLAFDSLIIILYLVFILFISPLIIRFLRNKNYNLIIQLFPVLLIVFLSSVAIAIFGFGGFKETLFFQSASIFSVSFLVLLSLILLMKNLWREQYGKVVSKLNSTRDKIGQSFSHK